METHQSKPIGIACGDPAGIGPEVILDWAKSYSGNKHDYMFFGPQSWVDELHGLGFVGRGLGYADFEMTPGAPTREGSLIARDALMKCALGCKQGRWSAAVTGPVSKEELQKSGFEFVGQTEYFGDQWEGAPVMGFVGKQLKVILATWHIPLHDVGHLLSPGQLIRAVTQADYLARAYGIEEPRIGVCGMNPHAGENGLMGKDEEEWIDPLLDDLRGKFPGLSSTQPGDTIFWRARQGEFDVVVALYHDQGLGPLKTLEFDQAVNVTLGLSFVRTSPDHGTGFAIAGKGLAKSDSFANSIEVAKKLAAFGLYEA